MLKVEVYIDEERELILTANVNSDLRIAVDKIIGKYCNKVRSKEKSHTLMFVEDKLEDTKSYTDMVSLSRAYDLYMDYCINDNEPKIKLTKQQFRKSMEELRYFYSKAQGNKSVFRGVKEKPVLTDEDLEWEL